MIKSVSILGSTGSIGIQTLDVVRKFGIKVEALSANTSIDIIEKQIAEFRPSLVSMGDEKSAAELSRRISKLDFNVSIMYGNEGNCAVATAAGSDMTIAAMVGISGLSPVVAAIRAGKDIALANKETLVAAGAIVTEEASKNNVNIYPVDSEHSAIWQCLKDFNTKDVSRIFLTASGGPFRGKKTEDLKSISLASALSHPTWNMGGKITIDSATLMNKGLEVIEAFWLFGVDKSNIEVVVHPQSIIHSMVEFVDGSVLAQMGFPDMRLPIQIALLKKERIRGEYKPFNPFIADTLTFEKPDIKTFRCLQLAYDALDIKGSMAAVMNSANEKAVELFMGEKCSFLEIPEYIEKTMERHLQTNFIKTPDLESIFELDKWSRGFVESLARKR